MNTPANDKRPCIHGSTEKVCHLCLSEGVYNERHGTAINSLFKDGKNESPEAFDVCFTVLREFHQWLDDHGWPNETKRILKFLREVNKKAPLKWHMQTLKKSYYVAKCFPDLKDPAKRILSLSCYKVLARKGIDVEALKAICKDFEERHVTARGKEDENYISVARLKQYLASEYGLGTDFPSAHELTVRVKNKSEFIKEIRRRLYMPRSAFKNRTIKVLISFNKDHTPEAIM